MTTSFVISVNWPLKCYQLHFGRVCPREIVLSISFYEFFPFGEVSTLSNLTGQSISSEHGGMGCCGDRDCIGVNEVVRNFMGFHVCFRFICAQWLCSVYSAWHEYTDIKAKCVENVCSTLHITDCFPYHIIRVFLEHTNTGLTLIGWVWTSHWRSWKWEWRGRDKHF